MLIIGCGNRERGDDGAGILVAEQLQGLGIEARIHAGDPLALIEFWSGIEKVILIDTVTTGAPAGTVHRWEADQLPPAAVGSSASTHGLDVAQAIELARGLHRLPGQLRIYGIEGKRFRLGEDISPSVRRAVEQVVDQIAAETPVPDRQRALL